MRLKFSIDLGLAFIVSAAMYGTGYYLRADGSYPNGGIITWVLYLIGIHVLPFVGPLAVVLIGLMKQRFGWALGPVVFGIAIVTYNQAALAEAARHALALDQHIFAPIEHSHDVIAIDGDGYCVEICKQILANTTYAFAIKRNGSWQIYRRIEGADCLKSEHRESYVDFIREHYIGICASRDDWKPGQSGLFMRHLYDGAYPARSIVGEYYKGAIFEAYERIEGEDRLLGRWLAGRLELPIGGGRMIGERFKPGEFYSALLDIPFQNDSFVGPASPAERLSALIPLIDDTPSGQRALDIATGLVKQNPELDSFLLRQRMEELSKDAPPKP